MATKPKKKTAAKASVKPAVKGTKPAAKACAKGGDKKACAGK